MYNCPSYYGHPCASLQWLTCQFYWFSNGYLMITPLPWGSILVKKIVHTNRQCSLAEKVSEVSEHVLMKSYLLVRASYGRFCVFLYTDLGHFLVIFCTCQTIFFKLLKSETKKA